MCVKAGAGEQDAHAGGQGDAAAAAPAAAPAAETGGLQTHGPGNPRPCCAGVSSSFFFFFFFLLFLFFTFLLSPFFLFGISLLLLIESLSRAWEPGAHAFLINELLAMIMKRVTNPLFGQQTCEHSAFDDAAV